MRIKKALLIISFGVLVSCGGGDDPADSGNTEATVVGADAELNNEYVEYVLDADLSNDANPIAIVETTKGRFAFEVYKDTAPQTAINFMQLVTDEFYNGLRFHLVEPGFVVQTGDPTGIGDGGADIPGLILEVHPDLSHSEAGIVGMAHSNNDPNSATSQFYITLDAQPSLDGKFAIFGNVVKGADIPGKLIRGDKIDKIVLVQLAYELPEEEEDEEEPGEDSDE